MYVFTITIQKCNPVLLVILYSCNYFSKNVWLGLELGGRYCLSVNVIAFVYAGFQAYDLAYYLAKGKHVIRHHLRRPVDFFMDQVSLSTSVFFFFFLFLIYLAYLP